MITKFLQSSDHTSYGKNSGSECKVKNPDVWSKWVNQLKTVCKVVKSMPLIFDIVFETKFIRMYDTQ